MPTAHLDINWTTFELCHADPRTAFERLCRMLFNQHFFDGKQYLHSDPNNPGIEVLPVINPKNGKKISFQAKYFETMDYGQILHSCKKAVEYYAGNLDQIYLYCNKDVMVAISSMLSRVCI